MTSFYQSFIHVYSITNLVFQAVLGHKIK